VPVAAKRHVSMSLGDRVLVDVSSPHAPMGRTVPTEGLHCCSLTCGAGRSAPQARALTVVLAAAAYWWVVLQGAGTCVAPPFHAATPSAHTTAFGGAACVNSTIVAAAVEARVDQTIALLEAEYSRPNLHCAVTHAGDAARVAALVDKVADGRFEKRVVVAVGGSPYTAVREDCKHTWTASTHGVSNSSAPAVIRFAEMVGPGGAFGMAFNWGSQALVRRCGSTLTLRQPA
jgi:hypothetical protein